MLNLDVFLMIFPEAWMLNLDAFLMISQWQEMRPGLRERGFQLGQQGWGIGEISGSAQFLKLLRNFHNAPRAEIETHAFQRMSMKGELRGVRAGFAYLSDSLGSGVEK